VTAARGRPDAWCSTASTSTPASTTCISSAARSCSAPSGPTSSHSGSTAPTSPRGGRSDRAGAAGLAFVAQRPDRPQDTDVRVAGGLGDILLATPDVVESPTREFVADYEGPFCISPRYERLVRAGNHAAEGLRFRYPGGRAEEAAIASVGLGVYLTVTGSTARDHGLRVGETLFPSETVLLTNPAEAGESVDAVANALVGEATPRQV
jgi:hypothetical protein